MLYLPQGLVYVNHWNQKCKAKLIYNRDQDNILADALLEGIYFIFSMAT